jgi:hypothetical protein
MRRVFAILPRHSDARAVDNRHHASRAEADRHFHRSHRLAPNRLADAFEDENPSKKTVPTNMMAAKRCKVTRTK